MSAIRRAFTLVELIVVIAILAVLIGLLIPAVQQARNAAARISCQNKMKQLGLGLQGYHDVQGAFPPGASVQEGRSPYPYSTWMTHLLPFVEQNNLWEKSIQAYKKDRDPTSIAHYSIYSLSLPLYECPADSRNGRPMELLPQAYVGTTSYLGVIGTADYNADGILYIDSNVHIRDILDGTSSTILIGERPPHRQLLYGRWYSEGEYNLHLYDTIGGAKNPGLDVAFSFCPPRFSKFAKGNLSDACHMMHFWSFHFNGANFLFADGSVRFLPYSAADILPDLATRAGGETVEIP
jgi:prepilin-type N-terminal cleavage/methylation domain-containing protein/prepilin-type processing-associated H-X9-DG protein